MATMTWLHQHGLISNYDDFCNLPAAVLEDAQLMIEHEAKVKEQQERKAAAHGKRR